jgi:hypothetical protein
MNIKKDTPSDLTINIPLHRNDTWGFQSTQNFFEAHPMIQEAFEEFLLAPEMYAGSNQRRSTLEYVSNGLADLAIAISEDFRLVAGNDPDPPEPPNDPGDPACQGDWFVYMPGTCMMFNPETNNYGSCKCP